MLSNYTLATVDSISDLRLKLEVLKALYDVFCRSSGLEADESTFVQTVKNRAHEIQLLSDALTTFLWDALETARRAEEDAENTHDAAKAAEPAPEKEAALRVILSDFTLEEKRSLCSKLHQMTT